jgi:hypothetical protein
MQWLYPERSSDKMGLPKLALTAFALSCSLAVGAIPDQMHPDFDLREVPLPQTYNTLAIGFLSDGRMVLATAEDYGGGEVPPISPDTKLSIVSSPGSASASGIKIKDIANNWHQIIGITLVNDTVYVSERDGFYQILDLENPGDLSANRKKIVSWPDENHWGPQGVNWHQWVFTPVYWKGYFYAPYSGSIVRSGGVADAPATTSYSGAFLKWDLTGKLEKVAGGLRSPNGCGLSPSGEMFVTDNQGSWLPSSTFMLIKPGKFYGYRQSPPQAPNWAEGLPYERPTAWLDHGNLRESPTQPVYVDKGRYQGDWIFGDVTSPGLVRVSLDLVDDTYNGSAFWFAKGTGSAAINRLAWGKDGALYIGTISTIGSNWPGGSKKPFYRMALKATSSVFDMRTVRSLADGVEILFTEPVDANSIATGNFTVNQAQYVRQAGYGLGKSTPEKRTVSATELSTDGKRVHLVIAGLKEDFVTYIKTGNVKSVSGAALWNNEVWFTENKISTRTWNAQTTAIAISPKARRLESLVRTTPFPGALHLRIDATGGHSASLRTLNGALVRPLSIEP